jgi:hypothetical protein
MEYSKLPKWALGMYSPAKERAEVEDLLNKYRPVVLTLIVKALNALPICKARLTIAKKDPAHNAQALSGDQLALDGLRRFFQIDERNPEAIDTVVRTYESLKTRFLFLPNDQTTIDYSTFIRENPQWANMKVPFYSDREIKKKMVFTPMCRLWDKSAKFPFEGLDPFSMPGIQLHEMCHFYFDWNDGDPATSTTPLFIPQSYQLFANQLAMGSPIPNH